jgi:hypothetical protein
MFTDETTGLNSNSAPRGNCAATEFPAGLRDGFQDRRNQPLCHPSGNEWATCSVKRPASNTESRKLLSVERWAFSVFWLEKGWTIDMFKRTF